MDSGHTTTRKGFLKGAGLALVGLFTFGGSKALAARPAQPVAGTVGAPSAMARVRPAKGAVARTEIRQDSVSLSD